MAGRKFKPLDLSRLRTHPIRQRRSKVGRRHLGASCGVGATLEQFLDSLPPVLAAGDLRAVARRIAAARGRRRTVLLGMGAHVIKVGLSPLVIDFMERGVIDAVALNGAGIIHDFELACVGRTSEPVEAGLDDGSFGMAEETAAFLNEAIRSAARGEGIGAAVGAAMLRRPLRHRGLSILAAGARLGIPVTVHVGIGTDVIHMHPGVDGEALGRGALADFHALASVVATLDRGVYLNVGSAVLLPEVFLKALTLARNLGHRVRNLTTVNMDFIPHYRALANVVTRPTRTGGKGYHLTGHHEIMLPLLFAAVNLELAGGAEG